MSEKDDEVIVLIEDNPPQQQSPMIRSDFVNVNAPLTPMSQDNRLLTLYEFNDKRNSVSQTESSDIYNDINYRKDKLYKTIKENKKKITTSLYIISAKYDLIYFRYNRISLLILIISTITTFIEAIRLTLINYQNDNADSEMSMVISKSTISLIINMISLLLGTLLTILSSIVKFRNYRENMEKLKNIHDTLFNYKISYNKQKDLIDYFTMSNSLTVELFDKLVENVETMNKEIKDINIFENIRIKDIIKFNRIKIDHDIELKKMTNKRELEFLKLAVESTKNKNLYEPQKHNHNDNNHNNHNNNNHNNNDNNHNIEKKYICFI
jgi:uncharacterized integral membrane protein